MAVTQVKPLFINSSGVYQGVTDGANGNYVALSRVTIDDGSAQAYPQTTDLTDVATIGYVNDAAAAAINGLDYKQAAQYIVENAGANTLAQVLTNINGTTGIFAVGNRVLVNWQTPNVSTGIYVLAGSDGSWTWARSDDMDTGSDASGDYVFCLKSYSLATSTASTAEVAVVIQQFTGSAVVGTNALSFAPYGMGISYSFNAPLSESNGTVSLDIDSTTLGVNGSQELAVEGLPLGFKVNNIPVSNNVTQSNLDTLVDGVNGDATALHRHQATLFQYPRASAITVGKAVTVSSGNAVEASKTDGKVVGVVYSDTGSASNIASSGIAIITAPTGSPSQGDNLYVNTSGDYCTYATLGSGDYATKVGKYLGTSGPGGTHQIAIAIQEFGIKP